MAYDPALRHDQEITVTLRGVLPQGQEGLETASKIGFFSMDQRLLEFVDDNCASRSLVTRQSFRHNLELWGLGLSKTSAASLHCTVFGFKSHLQAMDHDK